MIFHLFLTIRECKFCRFFNSILNLLIVTQSARYYTEFRKWPLQRHAIYIKVQGLTILHQFKKFGWVESAPLEIFFFEKGHQYLTVIGLGL